MREVCRGFSPLFLNYRLLVPNPIPNFRRRGEEMAYW